MISAVLDDDTRIEHMAYALKHGPAPLEGPLASDGAISIVGYGSSLKETWQDIEGPIAAMSGAAEFLESRGVQVDYYIGLEPRAHKLKWLSRPSAHTTYLMASVCCPFTWAMLEGYNVRRWHALGPPKVREWLLATDPQGLRIKTGSEVGTATLRLMWKMGFRRFHLHGMDHIAGYAGECPNPGQTLISHQGIITTPQLLFGALQMAKSLERVEHTIHGPSLLKVLTTKVRSRPITLVTEGRASLIALPNNTPTFDHEGFLEEARMASQGAIPSSLTIL